MARARGQTNPRHIAWIEKAIMEHPGDQPWAVHDLSIWTKRYAKDENYRQGVSPARIDDLIYETPRLMELAQQGRVALPPKTTKGKDPAWYGRIIDPSIIVRVSKGVAWTTMKAEWLERANSNPDPDAREHQIEMIEAVFALATATPGQRMDKVAEATEVAESFGHREADLLMNFAEVKGLLQDLRDEQRVARQERQLLLRHMGATTPEAPRGRGRPRRDERPESTWVPPVGAAPEESGDHPH